MMNLHVEESSNKHNRVLDLYNRLLSGEVLNKNQLALEYGVKVSGATVHFVSEECDAGPIVLQKAVYIQDGDTPEVLQRRVMEQAEWVILPQAVSLFCQGRLRVEGRTVRILPQ